MINRNFKVFVRNNIGFYIVKENRITLTGKVQGYRGEIELIIEIEIVQ